MLVFFTETLQSRDYFAVNDIKEVFNFEEQPDGKFLDFAVNFGTNRENIRRNYKKIQSAIAEVGGLFKGIYLIMIVIRMIVMKHDVYEYLNYFILNSKHHLNIEVNQKQDDNIHFNQIITKLRNRKNEKFEKKIFSQSEVNNWTNTHNIRNNEINDNRNYDKSNFSSSIKHDDTNTNLNILKIENNNNIVKHIRIQPNCNKNYEEYPPCSDKHFSRVANHLSSDKDDDYVTKTEARRIITTEQNYNPQVRAANLKQNSSKNQINLNDFKKHNSIIDKHYANNSINITNFYKLKRKNTTSFYENFKDFPKTFEILAVNYLSQKEILKLITDFSLFRSLIFDEEQNLQIEAMSRNIDLITKVMVEKETIIYKLLNPLENPAGSVEKVNQANIMIRLNEMNK